MKQLVLLFATPKPFLRDPLWVATTRAVETEPKIFWRRDRPIPKSLHGWWTGAGAWNL